MKKFFALFALILAAAIPLCLVGCKSKYDNLSIEMESSYEIVLGESADDSITIEARVTGSSDENGGKLSFSPDNEKLVKISQEFKNGINYITLKALAPGKVNIEARTLEGGVTKTFVVNIIQPIKNFTIKSGNFSVVRGSEWKIDVEKNLKLEPTNTTQTDFVVSFGANQDISDLEIENNVLKVSKNSTQDEIVLNVQSASNPDIAPKEIRLVVLDEFVEIDKDTQANQSKFDDGDILVFEKNESMLTYDKLEEINIISNLLSESEKEIVVRVFSSRETDVNFENNSRLAVKKISSSKTYKTNGQVEYTDFVFSVRFADTVSSGTTTSLNFVASYVGFDLKKQLSEIAVAYELAPKTILVNDQDDLSEFTLFNFYSTAKKGQKLQFGILPSSVSSKNSKIMLVNSNNLEDAFDYLQFFRSNGEELFEGNEIAAGETIYARAKSGVRTGSFEVLLRTLYVNPQTNAPLSKVLKFNVLSGITEMNFENDDQINLQLNSAQNSAEILFNVAPTNIDITKIHIEEVDGLDLSTIAIKSQTSEALTLRFVVTAKNVGKYKIKVYSENGIEITKDIRVVNALESVVLSVQSPNENSAVGDRQIIGGELRYVAVSLGGAITLGENLYPNNSNYRVEYSYFEVESMPEYALSSYDYPNVVTSTSSGVLDYSQLLGYKKVVALKQGYAVVRAKYIPIGILNNQDAELEPIYKYFIVQGYKPIRTVVMSSNYETLYSLKSVGVFNKHLTMTRVQLSVFPSDATYANNIVWDYDNSGEYFDFDEESLLISAKNRSAGTISIIATIRELNRTYAQTLSLSILDAKTVSDIGVSGIGDSIYIENIDDTPKTFNINAIAFPNDAYNTKLRYDFVDQSGNVIGNIRISEDGVMTIPAGVGLSGFVRIAAEDCFQEDTLTGEYKPVGIEGKNIILIPTLIANGTSKDTAIKINSKEELAKIDTKKHYKIQNDIDVSGISFENFSGGLYGYDSESRVVLSGFDRTFIQTLAKTGCVEDLQISCDIEMLGGNGVLVGKNEGYINNVFASGKWKGILSLVGENVGKIYNSKSEVAFVGEKFGGIALSNFGEINNCSFSGSIIASNQAAGIVLSNSGLVEACSTLLVGSNSIKLASTFDPQARIAGVCVENLNGGKILRSYIHSYKTNAAFVDSDSAYVGGLVHTNSGEITKSFSALLETDSISGFIYVNNAGAAIENCYSNTTFANFNYGTISKCYSVLDDERLNASNSCYSGVDATEKTVSDWLKTDWDISCTYEKMTIWKIYLDSQNPYLREISAEVKPESMTISIKEPKNANSYLKLSGTQVLLYRYESLVSPLTTAEKAKLNQYNTVSIYDLLSFEILPYNASSSPDMFSYTLSDGAAISISGLNINVLGLGKQTLTITSKLNPELSFALDIYTSYPIRDFNIYASSSSLDPSGALSDNSIIYLKRTYTQALYSKISSQIVLVDRNIDFKTHQIKINYANSSQTQELGLYILKFDTKETIDDFVCSLNFDEIESYSEFDQIKTLLSSAFARTFKVVVYNGAESLSVSQYSLEMEPIDTVELNVSLVTDISDEIIESNFNGRVIKSEIFNEFGVDYSDYFSIGYTAQEVKQDEAGFRTFDIKLLIQLNNSKTQISGNYYIRISANEEEFTTFAIAPVDVAIKLLPQSLQRIDYSHYYATSSVEEGREVLESNISPSNSLAPGQVGLLELNLFPTYSEISHVEIESIPNQDYSVKFQLYSRNGNDLNKFTMVQQNVDYSRTENGIIVGYTMINNGTIYAKTQIASDIPEELTFEIVVRAYKSKDDQNPIEQHVFLAAKFIPSARVEVDGQKDYIVMGRGTSKNMTITVVGEGDVEIYAKDGLGSGNVYGRAYVGQKTLIDSTNLGTQYQYTYTCPIFVGSKFSNEDQDIVRIEVVVSREVNGVREKKTTTLVVRVLDFVVNKVVLINGTDKYFSKVSVKTKFDFSYDITEPQTFTNEQDDIDGVKALKNKIENFKKGQYFTDIKEDQGAYSYKKSFMFVDSLGDSHSASTNKDGSANIYQNNEYLKFEDIFNENEYLRTVVTGLKTGTQKMKLEVSAFAAEDGREIYSITYDFDVVITNYSNEDKPMPIGSLEDFNAIFEQSDAQDYILTSDIEIGDHTPYSDTSKIRSLDGNNHKITIKSLSLGTDQTLTVALFETISEITTIKNLIVDYQIGEINANSSEFSNISVAGLAINNDGIVTNTHVLSMQNTSSNATGGLQISNSVAQSTEIEMAGFVLYNSGTITNSRVGDTSVSIVDLKGHTTEKALKIFAISGQDQMAGFVLNNSGIISASYAKNITIINNSKFETGNKTAGFVLNNQAGAKITGSYVRGVEGLSQNQIYVSGVGIESSFEVAGFVFDNYSYISDCYSNIKLYKEIQTENRAGLRSAGFVFRNEVGAQIVSSLSLSKIIEEDTSQQSFCGIDSENQKNNFGTITYSYYFSQKGKLQSVADGAQLLNETTIKDKDYFYGYSFTTLGSLDGMWTMTSRGPELVSANNIALSKRELVSLDEDNYEVAYVAGFEYGSILNPILIRSAKEFNDVFGTSKDDSTKAYFDSSKKEVFGNYRIINDIDLADLSLGGDETTTLSSTAFTFMRKTDEFGAVVGHGILEGNSMTIANLDLSITDTDQIYFGLFASIKNGAVVKNLNLTVKEISASSVNYVGALAGYVENSKIINVSAQIAQGQQVALIQGRNIVGGVVGAVSGTSELNNISSSISAHATYVDSNPVSNVNSKDKVCVKVAIPTLPTEGTGLNSTVSIAGSIAGAIYAKDINNSKNMNLSTINYAQIQKIKASGKFIVNAKIAGGLVGYVGKTTYIHDAWLGVSDGQNINVQANGVGGGAVGVSYGKFSHVRIEHNDVQDYSATADNLQREIEENVENYYKNSSNERKTYENMFKSTNSGQTLGGIIGVMNGGILEDSYTKLDVISEVAYNLGGIVGIVKNQKYEISRVYTFSNVQSKSTADNVMVGGLFGAVLSSGELDTVVGANYLDKNYSTAENSKDKFVTFVPFAGACTYVPSMTNVYTLNKVKDTHLDSTGAAINGAKSVTTLQTNLSSLFPASKNSHEVNAVFEIEESYFKSEFWARNVDDVLPHLTFGLEEQYFVIDKDDTAGDIRKMLKNSNKTFYIDGEVSLTSSEVIRAIQSVRNTIEFTGKLLGMPKDFVNANYVNKGEDPTLIGLQELFNVAVGATFADFKIQNPRTCSAELPSSNYGSLVGNAIDCSFSNVTVVGEQGGSNIEGNFTTSTEDANKNVGGLVGFAQGKTSFENIKIENINIQAGNEANIGFVAGRVNSTYASIMFKNCTVEDSSIKSQQYSGTNINVGGMIGLADGLVITSIDESVAIDGVVIDVAAQNVGGLVGNCTGTATLDTSASRLQIKVRSDAQNVGGIVGTAGTLNMTMKSDIVLTSSDEKNYGEIKATGTGIVNFGGVVGSADVVSIFAEKEVNFKTNDIEVSGSTGSTVCAGGLVGVAKTSVSITNVKVNTQGEIKNKVISITCAGDVTVGGLVGQAESSNVSNCWSGTDVEINDSTTNSNITFGGIIGSAGQDNIDGTNISIQNNVSYGRFFISSTDNPTSINAGGIAGVIQADSASVNAVTGNTTLTSLEIHRHATGDHNVNAVVGNRNSNKIGGSGNFYTYQLSLAVESDTTFATNKSQMSGVGVSDSNATLGSILNPIDINENNINSVSIENGKYYSISSSMVALTLPTSNNTSETNFVLIGNGNTITLTNSHIETLGSRTIISGLTVQGKYNFSSKLTNKQAAIGNKTYEIVDTGLNEIVNSGQGEFIKFTEAIKLSNKSDIRLEEQKIYFYRDGSNNIDIGELSDFDDYTEIDGIKYCLIKLNGTTFAIDEAKKKIYHYSKTENYKIGEIEFDESKFCFAAKINEELRKVTESNGEYYIGAQKLIESSEEECYYLGNQKVDLMRALDFDGELYIVQGSEDGSYEFIIMNDQECKIQETIVAENLSEEKELSCITKDVYKTEDNKIVNITTNSSGWIEIKIGDTPFYEVTVDEVEYVMNYSCTSIYNKNKVKTFEIDDASYYYFNDSIYVNLNNEFLGGRLICSINSFDNYEQAAGFVSTNNGFVAGVVVKSNYKANDFGGFVTTNNGAILYSSMNGQVYATSGDVAGFVLKNTGIIDYCHSTGAVQGNASNSYSFGANESTGSITNSYTICLNEANATNRYAFDNIGILKDNEYDPVATEIQESNTNELSCNLGNDVSRNGFWTAKGLTNSEKTKILWNYGYKTLSSGPFIAVLHLTIDTGDGTKDNPYLIANSRLLTEINSIGLNYSYALANNIDVSKMPDDFEWTPIGSEESTFTGIFDGNNKTIKNITQTIVDATTEKVVGGLFGFVGMKKDGTQTKAMVKNLILDKISINIKSKEQQTDRKYYSYAGTLAGYCIYASIDNVKVHNSTIVSSSDDSAYAGGLMGYCEDNNSSFSNIQITNSQITSDNTFAWTSEVEGIKSKKWIGFKYSDNFDMTQFVSYASQGVGNIEIDCSSVGNEVLANVQPLQKYQDTDDYDFTDFISSIYATGHNGGPGPDKDYIKLAGKEDINCISRISASYCTNNGGLKAKKRIYYVWTDSSTNPGDRYNNIDGTIRTKVCGVRKSSDIIWTTYADQDIINEGNFTGNWRYTPSISFVIAGTSTVVYKRESTKTDKIYIIGSRDGDGHAIWIKTSYLKFDESEMEI